MEQEEIRENDEYAKRQRKGHGFFAGVLAGMLVSAVILISGAAFFGRHLIQTRQKNAVLSSDVMAKIGELMGYIRLYYYDEVSDDQLASGIYAGLLEGVDDKYTEYYTAKEYADLQISTTQKYSGIGAGLVQDRDSMQVTVSHVYEGTPAEAAGLLKDDVVVMVGDVEAVSMDLSDLVTYIRGEEGTLVHLTVYREGEEDYLEFDVKRAKIDLPTVEYRMLDDKIGYIRILEFGEPTVMQFEQARDALLAQGMQAAVVDVRNNPGGMISSVTGILDDILPEGTVVYTQDKYGKREDYNSDEEKKMDIPFAVLINGNSASASEIFAGAMRDFEYGTLIGQKTYGKGVVQTIFSLKEGDAVKLTTAKYFTPKGENIHGTGIAPDIELEYEYQGNQKDGYDELLDNQVKKSMEVLDKELAAGR